MSSRTFLSESTFETVAPAESLNTNRQHRSWLLPVLIITAAYVLLIYTQIQRKMWYDELFTYYIAKAPTLQQLIGSILRWDQNPPTVYLITRTSIALFGDNIVAFRLPSTLEFYVAGLMLFLYTRRKVGDTYAAIPFLILCLNPFFFRYATEVRPYALVCMFFSSLLLSWDIAVTTNKRTLALWGVALSSLGLIVSHVFASFSILPFVVAELVRFVRTRKADYALWAALLLPTLGVISYFPLFGPYGNALFPPALQASPRKVAAFFWHTVFGITSGVFLAAAVGWLVSWKKPATEPHTRFRWADIAVFATLLANPILLNILMMHRAFWDRYCMTTALAVYVLIALAMAWLWRSNKYAGWTATLLLMCFVIVPQIRYLAARERIQGKPTSQSTKLSDALSRTRPDLPLVAANGVTFLALDHYESPAVIARLYYLVGGPAAVQYSHATIFEGFDKLKNDFPVRSKVEHYTDFVNTHHEFLVFGNYWWSEDWLLKKLAADGATITKIGNYGDEYPYTFLDTTLYDVVVRNQDGVATQK